MVYRGIRLITLDLTGTVFHFKNPPFVQYRDSAAQLGLSSELEDVKRGFMRAWKEQNETEPHFGATTHGNSLQWWTSLVHKTMKDSLGENYDRTKVENLSSHLYRLYSSTSPYQVFPDAEEFLLKLAKRQRNVVKLGVISNFDKRIYSVVDQLGLSSSWDFLISSESAGASKPQEKIFGIALEKSELPIEPRQALHIGDDLEKDYLGARAAGWQAALLDRSNLFPKDPVELQKIHADLTNDIFTDFHHILANTDIKHFQ